MLALLRLLLALSVFFTHVDSRHWFSGVGGDTAVELFFVISGFYIQEILVSRYSDKRSFYINRLLRIYPIYFFILIATFLTNPIQYIDAIRSLTVIGQGFFLSANISMIGLDQVYFIKEYAGNLSGNIFGSLDPANQMVVVTVAWSISLELMFYLVAPLLSKLKSQTILLIASTSLIGKYIFFNLGSNKDPWSYRFLPFEISFFLLGMLISRLRNSHTDMMRDNKLITFIWTCSLIGWYLLSVHLADHFIFPRELVLLSGTVIILLGVFLNNKSKVLRRIGDLSYPIYLSHILVASQIQRLYRILDINAKPNWIAILIFTLLTSSILVFLVSPIERIRSRIRDKATK